jgi:hypothetical protein
VAAHQCLDPTGAIGRTLRRPNLDYGDLDIGKSQRDTIARDTIGTVNEGTICDLPHRLFHHLPQHCASSATTDREAVERRERIGVEPNGKRRGVR